MGAVFRREVRSYFTSPIGYIFITAFFAYSGIMFSINSLAGGYAKLDSMFYSLLTIMIVLIPILTMRTIAVSTSAPMTIASATRVSEAPSPGMPAVRSMRLGVRSLWRMGRSATRVSRNAAAA